MHQRLITIPKPRHASRCRGPKSTAAWPTGTFPSRVRIGPKRVAFVLRRGRSLDRHHMEEGAQMDRRLPRPTRRHSLSPP